MMSSFPGDPPALATALAWGSGIGFAVQTRAPKSACGKRQDLRLQHRDSRHHDEAAAFLDRREKATRGKLPMGQGGFLLWKCSEHATGLR
jgi:hypothetical protein